MTWVPALGIRKGADMERLRKGQEKLTKPA